MAHLPFGTGFITLPFAVFRRGVLLGLRRLSGADHLGTGGVRVRASDGAGFAFPNPLSRRRSEVPWSRWSAAELDGVLIAVSESSVLRR